MDFEFSQEQVMLRNLAREFFSRESSAQVVRRLMEDATGYDESTWKQMAEMGLLGIVADPDLGMIDQALVLDEMGRSAFCAPYFASAVLAASALQAAGDSTLLPQISSGTLKATVAILEDAVAWQPSAVQMRAAQQGSAWLLSGTKRFVPWAHVADKILVVARTDDGTTVFILDREAPGLSIEPNLEMDRTNKTFTLRFDQVRTDQVLGEVNRGWDVIGPMLRRAAIGAAAEMLGAMRRCMDMSVEYAKVRH
ncbi:MAG TPA: acyl-CoA dehydrogenase family protein, partial [Chloroflexota bacterium]|nr:acyl-CoA dehydrogenase family protein [Chloroflexota bacterium]